MVIDDANWKIPLKFDLLPQVSFFLPRQHSVISRNDEKRRGETLGFICQLGPQLRIDYWLSCYLLSLSVNQVHLIARSAKVLVGLNKTEKKLLGPCYQYAQNFFI